MFAAGCSQDRKQPPAPAVAEDIPILWQHHGTYSNIARPLRVVARDADTLAQLPITEVPVDFRRQMVLVAATGPTTSDQIGIRITRVWKAGNRIRVQLRTMHPGDDKRGGIRRTSPYHIVVVPRSELNVEGFSATVPRGAFAASAPPGTPSPPRLKRGER